MSTDNTERIVLDLVATINELQKLYENNTLSRASVGMLLAQLYSTSNTLQDDVLNEQISEEAQSELIARLKTELDEEREKNRQLSKELGEQLVAIERTKYEYFEQLSKVKVGQDWSLLETNSKQFFATALYLVQTTTSNKLDYSFAVIEFGKVMECELDQKIYSPFINSIKTKYSADKMALTKTINKILSGKDRKFVPLGLMFSALNKPRIIQDDYYNRLQTYLNSKGWNTILLTNPLFYQGGYEYTEYFRNAAAHSEALTITDAIECGDETVAYLKTLLAACPK